MYRLEYSKKQRLFHICENNENKCNNKSWETIQYNVPFNTAIKISEMLEEEGW